MATATFEEALKKRYLEDDLNWCQEQSSFVIFAPPRPGPGKLPNVIAINDCEINHIGDLQKVTELCKEILELDLAQNRIRNITEILKILHCTSKLSTLNLSCNNLSHLIVDHVKLLDMPAMKELILNNTKVPWRTLCEFLHKMPRVEELYLCCNDYPTVHLEGLVFPSLKLLHLSGNPIGDWCEVEKVGKAFPNLETLVMVDCHLSSLGDIKTVGAIFKNMSIINITNNRIHNWEELEKLRHFPALTDVRLLGLPLFEDYTQHERRQLLIGRLPNIQRMNGSIVSDNEREDADRAFIRFYMNKECKPDRYFALEARYGRLDPLVDVNLAPIMVAKVKLRIGEECIEHKVKLKQTVSEFKSRLQRLTGLPAGRMRVFYVDIGIKGSHGPEELRYGAKFLYSYSVEDGDEFIIDEKI